MGCTGDEDCKRKRRGPGAPANDVTGLLAQRMRRGARLTFEGRRPCDRRDIKRSDWRVGRAGPSTSTHWTSAIGSRLFSGPASGMAGGGGDDLTGATHTRAAQCPKGRPVRQRARSRAARRKPGARAPTTGRAAHIPVGLPTHSCPRPCEASWTSNSPGPQTGAPRTIPPRQRVRRPSRPFGMSDPAQRGRPPTRRCLPPCTASTATSRSPPPSARPRSRDHPS